MKLLRITEQLATFGVDDVSASQRQSILEATHKKRKKEEPPVALYPKIEAIHAGMTKNKFFYPESSLKGKTDLFSGVYSWLYPYRKPVLKNHDKLTGDPLGRIRNAMFMTQTSAGRAGIIVIPEITDTEAIERILDERYFTVSIGGDADAAYCSICGQDIVKEGWCEHDKGKTYDDQECYWIIGNLWFSELSFVNVPADHDAKIVELGVTGADVEESQRIFTLNESHQEFYAPKPLQTAEQRLISRGVQLDKLYDIIATFRSSSVTEKEIIERWDEIVDTTKKEVQQVTYEELIKQVKAMEAEALNEFLAKDTEDPTELRAKVAIYQEAIQQAETRTQELEAEVASLTTERDSLQEQAQTDKEANDTKSKELEEQITNLQSNLDSQKEENDNLLNENTDLAAQLHQNLAERVVDMKRSLGRPGVEERDKAIEEHVSRKADSLIDTLSDLIAESETGIQGQASAGKVEDPTLATPGKKETLVDKSDPKTPQPAKLTEADVLKKLFSGQPK